VEAGSTLAPWSTDRSTPRSAFAAGEKEEIRRRLRQRPSSPFVALRAAPGVEHAEPELAIEVQYLERTHAGHLRHASFKGLTAS
jgi:ATP-dependent DNA ligase